MRFKLLFIILSFHTVYLFAQKDETILSGEIISGDNVMVERYSVYVLSPTDSTVLQSEMFYNRHFEMPVKVDLPFVVKIRALLYADTTLYISTVSQLNLGQIHLNSSFVLDDVVVYGSLRYKRSDIETIIITDTLRKGINSSAMLLGRLKGIKNDWITETISVGTESNVLVLVNGREVPSNYAMGLKPERIKKVHIIRQPAGKYSGYTVVLDLELFEDYVGLDISPNFSGMLSLKNKHTNREIFSVDGTWSRDRLNFYGTLAYNLKTEYQVSEYEKAYGKVYSEISSPIDLSVPNKQIKQNRGMIHLGSDYRIAMNQYLNLQVQTSKNDVKSESLFNIKSGAPNNLSSATNRAKNDYISEIYVVDFSYKGELSKRWNLNFSLLYNYYKITEKRAYSHSDGYSFERNYEGSKNYLRPYMGMKFEISKGWTLLIDNSLTWRNFTNQEKEENRQIYKSEDLRNRFNLNMKFSPMQRLELSLGTSWLATKDRYNEKKRTTSSLIPYFKLFWQPIKLIEVNLNYYNSIDNPTLEQLSPLKWQVDKMMFHEGNPYLRPRVMHYIEGQIELDKLFKVVLMHKISSNDITQYYYDKGITIETLTNSEYRHSYVGIEGGWNLGNGFSLSALLNYQWYTRHHSLYDKKKGHTYTIDSQLSYSLPRKGINILASFYLRKDCLPLLQGREYMQEEILLLGVNKLFLNDKLSTTLAFAMPTGLLSKRTFHQIEIPEFRSITYGDSRFNSYVVSLNLRFRIGNNKSKRQSQKSVIEHEK